MRERIEIRSISQSNKRMKFLKNVSKIVRTKPKPIAAIAIFLTVILFTGAFNVSTGSSLLSDLHPKSGLYVDLKNVEKWFGGILPLEIIITKNDSVEITKKVERFKINSKYSASNFNNKLCYLFGYEKRV